jgi:hypothetical protein
MSREIIEIGAPTRREVEPTLGARFLDFQS